MMGSGIFRGFLASLLAFQPSHRSGILTTADLILVDVENVRGKAGFGSYSHMEFVMAMVQWTEEAELKGNLSLIVDHGKEESSFWVKNLGLMFAGPNQIADDVIARECRQRVGGDGDGASSKHEKVVVVTADADLIRRCRGAHIVAPHRLLADIKSQWENKNGDIPNIFIDEKNETASSNKMAVDPLQVQQIDQEIQQSAQLLQAESVLQRIGTVSSKRKSKLQSKVRTLREQLALRDSQLNRVIHDTDHAMMLEWERRRGRSTRHDEWAGDRMLLAESLRQRCIRNGCARIDLEPGMLKKCHVGAQSNSTIVRLVVVSDTHGFERQLGKSLPSGDVLLHLGDFANEENSKQSLRDFEIWIRAQPFHTKIVVRGNHDPRHWNTNEAIYVTQYTRLSIQGLDLVIIPHSGKLSWKSTPTRADIVASHVPPHGCLDRTLTGEQVGSCTLRRYLELAPPSLWMCGHIHEARGCLQVGKTLVVNAANANDGLAERLDHGPIVIQLTKQPEEKCSSVEVLTGLEQDRISSMATTSQNFYERTNSFGSRELLLAIDLGLKTGVSLFSNDGRLLRYIQHSSTSPAQLRQDMSALMEDWETAAQLSNQTITRVAVEGADIVLRNVWSDLAKDKALVFVKPEQWRSELLITKEKTSHTYLKTAARAIAKQIVTDYGREGPHEGEDANGRCGIVMYRLLRCATTRMDRSRSTCSSIQQWADNEMNLGLSAFYLFLEY